MTPDLLEAQSGEAQVLRIFGIAPGSLAEATLLTSSTEGPEALAQSAGHTLGQILLDPAWIELVDQKDVASIGGLVAYLETGYDPPKDALSKLREALRGAPQYVLLVLSRAFGNEAIRFLPSSGLEPLVAVSLVHPPAPAMAMAPDDSAGPLDAKAPPVKAPMSQARISGMVAFVALIFIGLFTTFIVLIAG
ncbi:MAG: hypothetical protein AAGF94_00715 [Pseudomonadota bacterium]